MGYSLEDGIVPCVEVTAASSYAKDATLSSIIVPAAMSFPSVQGSPCFFGNTILVVSYRSVEGAIANRLVCDWTHSGTSLM